MPASPTAVKAKVNEHLARVESVEREKRAKTTVKDLLGDLRENNLINEELSEKLAFYSGKTKLALGNPCTCYCYSLY